MQAAAQPGKHRPPAPADTRWHATQEIEEHEDGSVSFRCTVSGLDEIVWWVLSFGPSCTVVAPKKLADRVRDLAVRTADRYARGPENAATSSSTRTKKRKTPA